MAAEGRAGGFENGRSVTCGTPLMLRIVSVFLMDADARGCTRDHPIAAFDRQTIEARPGLEAHALQPLYASAPIYGGAVAERLFGTGICLPNSTNLSASDLDRIIEVVPPTVRP